MHPFSEAWILIARTKLGKVSADPSHVTLSGRRRRVNTAAPDLLERSNGQNTWSGALKVHNQVQVPQPRPLVEVRQVLQEDLQ